MARWLVIAPSLALSEGGLSGGEGGEAGELADGSRRRSPLRYTAGVRASFLSLPPPPRLFTELLRERRRLGTSAPNLR